MNFVAIDFETANSLRSSACSIGMVRVRDGEIVDRYYSLIKPSPVKFDTRNVQVHKITPAMVADAPTFWDIWDDIYKFIGDDYLVAHQSSFERSVILGNFKEAEQEPPELHFLCSLYMARVGFPRRENHQLTSLCEEYLGFTFDHHNALEDAEACAKMAVYILANFHSSFPVEKIYRGHYNIGFDKEIDQKREQFLAEQKTFYTPSATKIGSLENEVVVFTGLPKKYKNKKAVEEVITVNGGLYQNDVTQKTTILIIGDSDYQYELYGKKSVKQIKAEHYIERGQNIYIIDEDKLIEFPSVISNWRTEFSLLRVLIHFFIDFRLKKKKLGSKYTLQPNFRKGQFSIHNYVKRIPPVSPPITRLSFTVFSELQGDAAHSGNSVGLPFNNIRKFNQQASALFSASLIIIAIAAE